MRSWRYYILGLTASVVSIAGLAADKIVPWFPGAMTIDSDEQVEAETRARDQAIEAAKARNKPVTESEFKREEGAERKPSDVVGGDGTGTSGTGGMTIDSDKQVEAEVRAHKQAVEAAKVRNEPVTEPELKREEAERKPSEAGADGTGTSDTRQPNTNAREPHAPAPKSETNPESLGDENARKPTVTE